MKFYAFIALVVAIVIPNLLMSQEQVVISEEGAAALGDLGAGVLSDHAILQVHSDDKGILIPKLDEATMTAITGGGVWNDGVDVGTMIFHDQAGGTFAMGFYYWTGTEFKFIEGSPGGGGGSGIWEEDVNSNDFIRNINDPMMVRINHTGWNSSLYPDGADPDLLVNREFIVGDGNSGFQFLTTPGPGGQSTLRSMTEIGGGQTTMILDVGIIKSGPVYAAQIGNETEVFGDSYWHSGKDFNMIHTSGGGNTDNSGIDRTLNFNVGYSDNDPLTTDGPFNGGNANDYDVTFSIAQNWSTGTPEIQNANGYFLIRDSEHSNHASTEVDHLFEIDHDGEVGIGLEPADYNNGGATAKLDINGNVKIREWGAVSTENSATTDMIVVANDEGYLDLMDPIDLVDPNDFGDDDWVVDDIEFTITNSSDYSVEIDNGSQSGADLVVSEEIQVGTLANRILLSSVGASRILRSEESGVVSSLKIESSTLIPDDGFTALGNSTSSFGDGFFHSGFDVNVSHSDDQANMDGIDPDRTLNINVGVPFETIGDPDADLATFFEGDANAYDVSFSIMPSTDVPGGPILTNNNGSFLIRKATYGSTGGNEGHLFEIDKSGEVGIGLTDYSLEGATAKLDINGDVRIRELPSSPPNANSVLVSDNDGFLGVVPLSDFSTDFSDLSLVIGGFQLRLLDDLTPLSSANLPLAMIGDDNLVSFNSSAGASEGAGNIFLGTLAGSNTQLDNNIGLGTDALANLVGQNGDTGVNIAIGSRSLGTLETGSTNVAIGSNAGSKVENGSKNIFIGARSGPSATTALMNNELWIGTQMNAPIIHGNMDDNWVAIGKTSPEGILDLQQSNFGALIVPHVLKSQMTNGTPGQDDIPHVLGSVVYITDYGQGQNSGAFAFFQNGQWIGLDGDPLSF
jgi:hypothetical protein